MTTRLLIATLLSACTAFAQTAREPLATTDIDDIARLVMLEDTRQFDEASLSRLLRSRHPEVRRRAVLAIGRIADKRGAALLETARADADAEVSATVVFATGQLREPAHVSWLADVLGASRHPAASREAATALGKIQAPEARAALARYLSTVPDTPAARPIVGEALLSIGRFTGGGDLAPIVRWIASPDLEVRWRAAWALFRPRDPAAFPHLLALSKDPAAEVRAWAVRGLAPTPQPGLPFDAAQASARLREVVKDPDRRVRTEALRALAQHDDDASFAIVLDALDAADPWLSVSAAESMARFKSRAETVVPRLVAATAAKRPLAVRLTALTPLVALAPDKAVDTAAALAREKSAVAQAAARQAFGRLGDAGKERLAKLMAEGVLAQPAPRAPRAATKPERPLAEYRRIVERWIVPDYNGVPKPRAIWETPRGTIELELYAGDAPLGVEHFIRMTESGEIVGTEFGRVVPHFVAQQRPIRDDITLRDEVNRHGLTRGNLSWASSGLDTGRPGYTLAITPQPHNEGNFTALGRVVSGMDVVERLELGDRITAARMAPAQTGSTTQAARPRRTEAEARAAAERNRQERAKLRKQRGKPVELISSYVKASVGPVPETLLADPGYRIDGSFYTKYADAAGIPVLASAKVPDEALLVARDIVNSMLAERPDIRKALIDKKWRTGVIAEVEMTMDIPEYSRMKRPGAAREEPVNQEDRDYHANRSRGLGGNPTTGAEENLLGYPGTRYWGEHIFVHEFAHAIMGGGIREVDPAMHAEIRAAYEAAMAAGKYVHTDGRKHYATTNPSEYWAEGVQWWFFSNYGECFAGNVKVETPEEFAAYDPALNELIGRVFKTHRIPMDVFHGRRIRPVKCPS